MLASTSEQFDHTCKTLASIGVSQSVEGKVSCSSNMLIVIRLTYEWSAVSVQTLISPICLHAASAQNSESGQMQHCWRDGKSTDRCVYNRKPVVTCSPHKKIQKKWNETKHTPPTHILINRSDTEPRDDAAKFELESLLASALCFNTVWNSIP